ncbi:hypothetical protein M2102_000560 [Fusobacterium sp. PH5-7]|uniref:DUF2786 domain-containing protein n=1 Tax=Fusobacterium sp. PH5-7 TaxID=2940528 RepID=UPI00247602E5|nr:DUF2786 domain-containing protein [Fusobacterium sp. PH5-7]MDH6456945.1 hypothetical protein [Fusobacterium sp. PH5-7]
MLDKLRKLRALSQDMTTTEAERELAYKRYQEIKKKYAVDDSELEEKEERFHIRVQNTFEKDLLRYILWSFDLTSYTEKHCSKLKVIFYTKKSVYEAIQDDFKFHSRKTNAILDGVLTKYLHTQIKEPELVASSETINNLDPDMLKAYWNNSWMNNENYSKKLKIED